MDKALTLLPTDNGPLSVGKSVKNRRGTSLIDIAIRTDVSKYAMNPLNMEELKDLKKLFKDPTGIQDAPFLHQVVPATLTTLPEMYKATTLQWKSTALSCFV